MKKIGNNNFDATDFSQFLIPSLVVTKPGICWNCIMNINILCGSVTISACSTVHASHVLLL